MGIYDYVVGVENDVESMEELEADDVITEINVLYENLWEFARTEGEEDEYIEGE